jgi:hypothetical protein
MYVAKHKDSFKIINKSEVETFNGSGPVPNLALGRSQVISRLPPPWRAPPRPWSPSTSRTARASPPSNKAPVRVVVVDRDGEDLPHGHLVPGDGDPARLAAQMGQVGELHHVLP